MNILSSGKAKLQQAANYIEKPYKTCWRSRRVKILRNFSLPFLPALSDRGHVSRKKFAACLIASPVSKVCAVFLRLFAEIAFPFVKVPDAECYNSAFTNAKIVFPFVKVPDAEYYNSAFTKAENEKIKKAFLSKEFEVIIYRNNIHNHGDVKAWRYRIHDKTEADPRILHTPSYDHGLGIRLKHYVPTVITVVKTKRRR